MADVIFRPAQFVSPSGDPPAYDLIELLFFAYRDFVRDADDLLAEFGFGRAHHRVLRELIESGFVTQSEGPQDRRERLLTLTDRGAGLALELSELQSRRILGALATCTDGTRAAVTAFLFAMIEAEDRDAVARLLARPAPERRRAKG
jgi:DNA-binding MarR family transcriptional regulator